MDRFTRIKCNTDGTENKQIYTDLITTEWFLTYKSNP